MNTLSQKRKKRNDRFIQFRNGFNDSRNGFDKVLINQKLDMLTYRMMNDHFRELFDNLTIAHIASEIDEKTN